MPTSSEERSPTPSAPRASETQGGARGSRGAAGAGASPGAGDGSRGGHRSTSNRVSRHSIDLDEAFQVGRMRRVWKSSVRDALRGQPIEDLHDYLDVHRNLTPFLERLRSLVV